MKWFSLLLVVVTAVIDTEVDVSVAAVVGPLEVSTTAGKMMMKTMHLITAIRIIIVWGLLGE